jgi:hypothetical protein
LAAALAPLTWVAVALLGASYYECAASGSAVLAQLMCKGRDPSCATQLPLVPCGKAKASEVQELLKHLRAQSQVRRWRWARLGGAEGASFQREGEIGDFSLSRRYSKRKWNGFCF